MFDRSRRSWLSRIRISLLQFGNEQRVMSSLHHPMIHQKQRITMKTSRIRTISLLCWIHHFKHRIRQRRQNQTNIFSFSIKCPVGSPNIGLHFLHPCSFRFRRRRRQNNRSMFVSYSSLAKPILSPFSSFSR